MIAKEKGIVNGVKENDCVCVCVRVCDRDLYEKW